MTGFSIANVKYMVQFAREYPDFLISLQPVGQIQREHNQLILNKIQDNTQRLWYTEKTIKHGWNRSRLSI